MDETQCPKCKSTIDDSFNVCPYCGHNLRERQTGTQTVKEDPEESQLLWGLLGFFIPVAGLVLYLVWQTERPLAAKAAGTGALISIIAGAVMSMFGLTAVFGMFGGGMYMGI